MSPGNVDDMNAPRSMKNIVQEVMDYIEQLREEDENGIIPDRPTDFQTYDDALAAVWPELHKASNKAHLLVAVSIYVDIAERWGFEVPPEIREMIL